MTGRANSTGTQTLSFDVENRLSQVQGTGGGYSGTATYVYDGDGNRIKKTEGGVTTLYVNRYYDVAIGSPDLETSHYYLGGTQVAIYRSDTGLEYIHQDSLNSSSLSTDDDGAQVSKTVFLPFGATRSSTGTLATDQLYTGQRLDGTGLYFYNARYYDASIGRFISPDDVTPNYSNPQDLNRYSYVHNDPLTYNDPTGHWPNFGKIINAVKDAGKAAVNKAVDTANVAAGVATQAANAIASAAIQGAVGVYNAASAGVDALGNAADATMAMAANVDWQRVAIGVACLAVVAAVGVATMGLGAAVMGAGLTAAAGETGLLAAFTAIDSFQAGGLIFTGGALLFGSSLVGGAALVNDSYSSDEDANRIDPGVDPASGLP